MAYNIHTAKKELTSLADDVTDYILRCVIYRNDTGDLDRWCRGLANYLEYADSIRVPISNGKLMQLDYNKTIFWRLGTEEEDAKSALYWYGLHRPAYPPYYMSDELVTRTFEVFKEIKESFSYMFTIGSYTDWDVFYKQVSKIMKENI